MFFRKKLVVAITLGALMGIGMLLSCGGHSDKIDIENRERVMKLDSLVRVKMNANPEDALAYIDSLEESGSVSNPVVCYCRGLVYNAMRQRTTSSLFFEKALEGDELQQECPELFYKASDYLSTFLSNREQNAEALEVANKYYEVARLDESPEGRQWTAIALHAMGYYQMQLGMKEMAERSFSMSYMALSQIVQADSSYNNLLSYARVSVNILDAYTTTGQYDDAMKWLPSAEVAAERLAASPECVAADRTKYVGAFAFQKAVVLAKLGSRNAANEAYRMAQELGYFNTVYGCFNQTQYLRTAERWDDLAALTPKLDSIAQVWQGPMSFYFLQEYMAPRFTAYLKSGRKEQALELAGQIVNAIDSVALHEQNHEMQEITAIANRKDMETDAAKQEADLAYLWVKILSITLVLLIVGIIGYAVYQNFRSENK